MLAASLLAHYGKERVRGEEDETAAAAATRTQERRQPTTRFS